MFDLDKKFMRWQLESLQKKLAKKIKGVEELTRNGKLNGELKERLSERNHELKERLLEVEYLIKKTEV